MKKECIERDFLSSPAHRRKYAPPSPIIDFRIRLWPARTQQQPTKAALGKFKPTLGRFKPPNAVNPFSCVIWWKHETVGRVFSRVIT